MSDWEVRAARRTDVHAIVQMLADDQLGATRDAADDLEPYLRAFDQIEADPNQYLLVAADDEDLPIATLQLTMIPGLARRGSLRGQIEAVRVHSAHRGSGLGRFLVQWAVDESRRRGCALVQLTSDKSREDAHRFYKNLGFTSSHIGFKQQL